MSDTTAKTDNRDPFPDERLEELLTEFQNLRDDENSRTWYDADPEVAWNVEDSYHGKIRAILESAGFEGCYHGDALFHLDVKVSGMASYRGFHDKIGDADLDNEARDRVIDIAQDIQEWDLWDWREELTYLVDPERIFTQLPKERPRVYQCGRSGGYLNSRDLEKRRDIETLLRIAQHAVRSKDNFNSREYGEWLGEEALERYHDERIEELASPRIERIEA